jgi:hypothetical protein
VSGLALPGVAHDRPASASDIDDDRPASERSVDASSDSSRRSRSVAAYETAAEDRGSSLGGVGLDVLVKLRVAESVGRRRDALQIDAKRLRNVKLRIEGSRRSPIPPEPVRPATRAARYMSFAPPDWDRRNRTGVPWFGRRVLDFTGDHPWDALLHPCGPPEHPFRVEGEHQRRHHGNALSDADIDRLAIAFHLHARRRPRREAPFLRKPTGDSIETPVDQPGMKVGSADEALRQD